jgi:undecaprenyl diphosphate synthase
VLEWCETLNIPQVTVWVLSIENLERPPEEILPLLEVIEQKIKRLARHPATARCRRRIRAVGHFDALAERRDYRTCRVRRTGGSLSGLQFGSGQKS